MKNTTYKQLIQMGGEIQKLNEGKLKNFKEMTRRIQGVMRIIGKNTVTLKTSEPIGPGHNVMGDAYHLLISVDKVFFVDNLNRHVVVDDAYLHKCPWFQTYVYVVEIELQMERYLNHLKDSIAVIKEMEND